MNKKLKVVIPPTDYPAVQVTVEHPDGTVQVGIVTSGLHSDYEFTLPEGVEPEQCGVFAELCVNGRVDPITRPIVIQEPVEPVVSVEPESEVCADPVSQLGNGNEEYPTDLV